MISAVRTFHVVRPHAAAHRPYPKLKIVRRVVVSLPVYVMHSFAFYERTTEFLFHDYTMLSDIAAFDKDVGIAFVADFPLRSFFRSVMISHDGSVMLRAEVAVSDDRSAATVPEAIFPVGWEMMSAETEHDEME